MKFIQVLLIGGLLVFFGWIIIKSEEATRRQHDSEAFPHVTGVVESSSVTTTHTSKGGTHYHVHIGYRYVVAGLSYFSYLYRYDGHPTDGTSVNAILAKHPPGAAVEVYYNLQNPEDAVLSTGVDASDVAMPFLMAGMGLFLLGGIFPLIREFFSVSNAEAGGIKIISEMLVTRARLPRFEPIKLGVMTAAGLCVLAALLIMTSVLQPPWPAGQWSVAGVVLGAGAVYAVQYFKIRSGYQDLVIDEAGRTVQLPLTYKRRERTPISFADIRSVMLNKVRHQSRNRVYYTYLVVLELKNNAQEKLVDLKLARAKGFASWLKEKLGVPVVEPEDEV